MFAGNFFIQIDENSSFLTSSDGIHWQTTDVLVQQPIFSYILAQNLFIATGNYGQIATSQDGVNWEISQDFSIETPWDLTSIAYGATSAGNNIYIATGNANSVFVADAQ